jgi:hypothetical protein
MADRDLEKSIEWVNPAFDEDMLRAKIALERAQAWAKLTTFVPYDEFVKRDAQAEI